MLYKHNFCYTSITYYIRYIIINIHKYYIRYIIINIHKYYIRYIIINIHKYHIKCKCRISV